MRFALFILALGCCPSIGVRAAGASFATETFSLSPDEKTIAVVHGRPYSLELRGPAGTRSMGLPEIDQVEGTPEIRVSWSADSGFVALQFIVDEATTALEVVDTERMEVVWSKAVTESDWRDQGHEFLVVPAHDIGDLQDQPGLVRIDAATREERLVAADFLFTGNIDVGKSVVVAQEVRLVDDIPVYSLQRVDLDGSPTQPTNYSP